MPTRPRFTRRTFLGSLFASAASLLLLRRWTQPGIFGDGHAWEPGDFKRGVIVRGTSEDARRSLAQANQFFLDSATLHLRWAVELCVAARACAGERCFPADFLRLPQDTAGMHGFLMKREAFDLLGARCWLARKDQHLAPPASQDRMDAAKEHLQERYWSLPTETLAGIQGTISCLLAVHGNVSLDELARLYPLSPDQKGSAVRIASIETFSNGSVLVERA